MTVDTRGSRSVNKSQFASCVAKAKLLVPVIMVSVDGTVADFRMG